jgi:hypothetical protein
LLVDALGRPFAADMLAVAALTCLVLREEREQVFAVAAAEGAHG